MTSGTTEEDMKMQRAPHRRLRAVLLASLVAALMVFAALPAAAGGGRGGGNSQGGPGQISPDNITWE